jgi:DNA polymerase III subunit epsilon
MAAPELLLIFDTETTGLPRFVRGGLPDPVSRTAGYDGCRVVSVAWLVVRAEDHVVVAEGGGLIRPEGFVIPAEAQAVHGISTAHALQNGEPFGAVAGRFVAELRRCGRVCGHNVGFDVNVLAAEFARRRGEAADYFRFALPTLLGLPRVCTMALGKQFLGQARNPKLGVLYEALFGRPLDGAHDAAVDTLACYRCLTRLAPAPLEFAPGPWRVTLREIIASGGSPQPDSQPDSQPESPPPQPPQPESPPPQPPQPESPPPQPPQPESPPPQPPQPDPDAAALEAMGYSVTMDCEAEPEPEPPEPEPERPAEAGPPIEVSAEPSPEGALPGPPAAVHAGGMKGFREPLLRAAVVECRTLAEVAAVMRGAVAFAREHYPGRAVRTRVPVLRRGVVEMPVGV